MTASGMKATMLDPQEDTMATRPLAVDAMDQIAQRSRWTRGGVAGRSRTGPRVPGSDQVEASRRIGEGGPEVRERRAGIETVDPVLDPQGVDAL